MRVIILCLLTPLAALADNVTCYYPNGVPDPQAYPCNGGKPMCCPNEHTCLDNGICFNPSDQSFGRYSCVERPWGGSCPQNCWGTPGGNEAVVQCDDGSWCCNRDSVKKEEGDKCCEKKTEERRMFEFGGGEVFAVIKRGSAVATTTNLPRSASEPAMPMEYVSDDHRITLVSTGMVAGSAIANSRSATAPTSSIATSEAVAATTTSRPRNSSEGQPLPATSATTAESSTITISDSTANTDAPAVASGLAPNAVIGIAVGVPVGLAAIGIIAFLFWRNRRAQSRIRPQTPPDGFTPVYPEKANPSNYTAAANYPGKAPSEIDSREVRIPISPQDTSHMVAAGGHMQRDQTTNTLYPNAQPNYANPMSPSSTYTGPGTPAVLSNPSQNFDEWAVTPRLQQQHPRWSGTTAQDGGVGTSPMIGGDSQGSNGSQHGQGNQRVAHELMGRPQIPTTIAELE